MFEKTDRTALILQLGAYLSAGGFLLATSIVTYVDFGFYCAIPALLLVGTLAMYARFIMRWPNEPGHALAQADLRLLRIMLVPAMIVTAIPLFFGIYLF